MNILITGSEGTLGRVLKAELRSRGHAVWGVDLTHTADPRVLRADVAEARQLDAAFEKINGGVGHTSIDLVYHLAAEFGRLNGAEYPEQLWRTNQIGTRNVIRFCVGLGARLVLAGSSEAYGETQDSEKALTEAYLDFHAPHHHNEYALSKWAQERQVFIAAETEGLKAVVLRFFNAYGPGEYYTPYRSVVCLFCYRMLFGIPITVYRNYHRVFLWIGDWARTVANVADRFDRLAQKDLNGHLNGTRPCSVPVYNIGGSEYRSVEELAAVVKNVVRRDDWRIRYADREAANVTNKLPDIAAAVHDLDHDPRVTLEEGVPQTVDWMRRAYGAFGTRVDDEDARLAVRVLSTTAARDAHA